MCWTVTGQSDSMKRPHTGHWFIRQLKPGSKLRTRIYLTSEARLTRFVAGVSGQPPRQPPLAVLLAGEDAHAVAGPLGLQQSALRQPPQQHRPAATAEHEVEKGDNPDTGVARKK